MHKCCRNIQYGSYIELKTAKLIKHSLHLIVSADLGDHAAAMIGITNITPQPMIMIYINH